MAEGRGKKVKKPRWQLVLGLKQVLCGALGLTWMMVIIFILGVLAGRGDIYRWLSGWGLVTMEASRVAQWPPPAAAPPGTPGAKPLPAAAAAIPGTPPPAPTTSVTPPPPVTGSPAPPPSPSPHTKKSKRAASLREQKAKQEEMRRLRREVAKKLKFQNSFDSSPYKPKHGTLKLKEKPSAAKGASTQSRVARFRDAKAARDKLAELQKKGEKVTLKSGKDKKGAYYDIIRQTPAHAREADGLAQKTPKSGKHKPKTNKETGH